MFFRTGDGEGGEKYKMQENDSRGCLVRDFSLEKYDGNSLRTYYTHATSQFINLNFGYY